MDINQFENSDSGKLIDFTNERLPVISLLNLRLMNIQGMERARDLELALLLLILLAVVVKTLVSNLKAVGTLDFLSYKASQYEKVLTTLMTLLFYASSSYLKGDYNPTRLAADEKRLKHELTRFLKLKNEFTNQPVINELQILLQSIDDPNIRNLPDLLITGITYRVHNAMLNLDPDYVSEDDYERLLLEAISDELNEQLRLLARKSESTSVQNLLQLYNEFMIGHSRPDLCIQIETIEHTEA